MNTAFTSTELPHYNGANDIDLQSNREALGVSRRQVLIASGVITASLVVGDQLGGVAERVKMKHNPEASIFENPDSNLVVVAVPGNRNDGHYMGALLHKYAFGDVANTVAISYAQDNIDALKLAALIKSSVDSVPVPDPSQKKIIFYLNSIAAAISVPVFEILHANGVEAELVIFDSGLRTREGLRGVNEIPAKLKLDKASYSRAFNKLLKWVVGSSIPPAEADKDPQVDLGLAYGHRWETVNCDSITQGAQAASLDLPVKPGRLKDFAKKLVYFKTGGTNKSAEADDGVDPLIKSELNAQLLAIEYTQAVEMFIDHDRSPNSHGNGPIWPKGLSKYLKQYFGITR